MGKSHHPARVFGGMFFTYFMKNHQGVLCSYEGDGLFVSGLPENAGFVIDSAFSRKFFGVSKLGNIPSIS